MSRLIQRIRGSGPITFADFMESALYDPDEGFYERPAVGEEAHFVTSPHVSPAFGDLLARQLGECWEALASPEPFVVIEAGAGDGTLAAQVLRAAGSVPEFGRAIRYVAVERSRRSRALLAERGIEAVAAMRDAPRGVAGCVIATELLDNLPFHRLRDRDGRLVEVMVGAEGGRLVEVEAEPSAAARAALRVPPRPGEERPVSPAALAFLADVRSALSRGYAFLFDYGFGPGDRAQPVRAYRRHRIEGDLLEDPGSRDLTTEVDLEALSAEAARLGLRVWGPVSQRDALLALGFEQWIDGVRRRQAEAERAGDSRAAIRLYSARQRATILVDEGHLGRLSLLALGAGDVPRPAALAAFGDRD